MAFLSYGADPAGAALNFPGMIDLKIVDTLSCERQPVYDRQTYLYTKWELHVSAVYSPAATAYTLPANPQRPAVAAAEANVLAPVTDAALREYLMQPQRRLVYKVGKQTMLACPRESFRLDAANGPLPLYCEVAQIGGWKTFLVRFGIQCAVNEGYLYKPGTEVGNSPPVILSHLWSRERDVDADHFSTLITVGRAVFDTSQLRQLDKSPDDYFEKLVHPLEASFRRDSIQVTVTEDGAELDYVIIDRETPLSLIRQGVTRIEAYHTTGLTRLPAEETVKTFAAGTGRALKAFRSEGVFGGLLESGKVFFGVLEKSTPVMTHDLVAKVWGNRDSRRRDLEKTARDLILARLANSLTLKNLGLWGFNSSVTHELTGKFVEARASFVSGPALKITEGGPLGVNALANFPFPLTSVREKLADIVDPDKLNEATAPPGGKKSRGTYLGALFAQKQGAVAPWSEPLDPPFPRQSEMIGKNP